MNLEPTPPPGYKTAARVGLHPRHRAAALILAAGLQLAQMQRASGEDHVDYRYEIYREDANRISVDTQSALFEFSPKPWLTIKGEAVYDTISGASPTGAPPPSQITFVPPSAGGPKGPFSTSVPLAEMHDKRYAGDIDATFAFGPNRITPLFAYSEESDYISRGIALNYSLDLNEKNTTLNFGWSHDFDEVLPKGFLKKQANKDSDEFLIGVNQLLSPKTVLTANLTYGNVRGYLNDQYKGVFFVNDVPQLDPVQPALEPERRPGYRDHYVAYVSVTQYLTPLHASVEGSYRFYHDSYGISANTLELAWYQKLGKRVTIAPMLRYYRQTAASFYAPEFPDFNNAPRFYSADYRLSQLESFTAGVSLSVKATSWLSFDLSYKRYIMNGLDHATSRSAYPSANIVTAGARVWF